MRALVFSLRTEPLTLDDLRGLPGMAALDAGETHPDGIDLRTLDRLAFQLEDGRILVRRVPSEALPAQLDALRQLIADRPLLEPTLPETLTRVREAMEFVLETSSEVDIDTFDELILGVVERLEGFSVWSHGVFDGLGRPLLDMFEPSPAPVPVDVAATVESAADAAEVRPAAELVARGRALSAMARRGTLEAAGPTAAGAAEIQHLRAFVESPELAGALDRDAAGLMALNPGAWSQRTLVEATWLTESVAVLAWALGLDVPPPDDEMVESEPLHALFCLGRPCSTDLQLAVVRPRAELEAELTHHRERHGEVLRTLASGEVSPHAVEGLYLVATLAAERVRALTWLLRA